MKDYKRLTDREIAETLKNTVEKNWDSDSPEAQCYIRLAELEDKIERGELISTVRDERGDQELAFFVPHNAEVRKQAVKEFVSILEAHFHTVFRRGLIEARTCNYFIGQIEYVLDLEGYKK